MAERLLGTMVTYGYSEINLADELDLAVRIGASVLEILPEWSRLPDPAVVRRRSADRGLSIHSAHGCWGGRTIRARRVDLGAIDPSTHRESIDDLKECVDWLAEAGGRYLVVHPGGLSLEDERQKRRMALARGLRELAEHARGTRCDRLCREHAARRSSGQPHGRAGRAAARARPSSARARARYRTRQPDGVPPRRKHWPPVRCWRRPTSTTTMAARIRTEPPGHGTIDWPEWGRCARSDWLRRTDSSGVHSLPSPQPIKLQARAFSPGSSVPPPASALAFLTGCDGRCGDGPSAIGWRRPFRGEGVDRSLADTIASSVRRRDGPRPVIAPAISRYGRSGPAAVRHAAEGSRCRILGREGARTCHPG